MKELDHKEDWTQNWLFFQTMVLEKTLESSLDSKDIKPVNPKGTWIFTARLILGRSQDGRGIGWGDHFLPYKFIERTTERWANFTKQLLIASRGHQAPRKASHCLQREAGQRLILKLQYFGHLMWRADSLEKTLMLGNTEGRSRRGRQKMGRLDGITVSTDMSLGDSEGQGSLACYSLWGRKKLDTTEWLNKQ